MKKNVLLLCFSQDLIPRHESMLATLNAAGFDTYVVTWDRSEKSQPKVAGTRYESIKLKAPVASWQIVSNLPAYYREVGGLYPSKSFDICILTHMMQLPLIGRLNTKHIVYDIAEYLNFDLSEYFGVLRGVARPFIERFEKHYIKQVSGVTYVGSKDNWLQRYVSGAPNSIEINNFPDLTRLPHASLVDDVSTRYKGKKIVAYVGGVSGERGIWRLLDAAPEVHAKEPQVHFVLMGRLRSDAENIHQTISARGMAAYVEVIEHKPYVEMLAYLSIAKLGVALYEVERRPSVRNKFGKYNSRKILTYMKMGLPVLVSEGNPFADFVSEVGCGDVVNQKHPKELAQKVTRLIADDEPKGRIGRETIEQRYNWQFEEQLYLEFMRNLENA